MEHPTRAVLSLLPSKQQESGSRCENSQKYPSWKHRPTNWKAGPRQSCQTTYGPPKYIMPANWNFSRCRILWKTVQRSSTNTQPQTTTGMLRDSWQKRGNTSKETLSTKSTATRTERTTPIAGRRLRTNSKPVWKQTDEVEQHWLCNKSLAT